MRNRAFRLLKLVQGFFKDRRVVPPRKSRGFSVIMFIGKIRKIRANV